MVSGQHTGAGPCCLLHVSSPHSCEQIVAIIGRRLGRIAHANPLPVLDAIFTQLKSYDNLIPITLDALKYGVAPPCIVVCSCPLTLILAGT